uniref:Fibronectin type-III domain-containing protein n=1 Tax=Angiostrongylus cantonensis TaxID=6313 RepID=A0A158P782_ANGCA
MESGSVFDFVGSAALMRFKVTLVKKDFNNLDDIVEGGVSEMFKSHTVDELQLQWQQKISLHTDQSNVQNDKWAARNPVVDLPLRRNHRTIRCDKKLMYIMMYQGSLNANYNDRDEYVICRITLLNERSMIFEPRLTHSGYRIQSKIGEYRVLLQVWDDNFTSIVQPLDRVTVVPPNLPEAQLFELPEEETVKVVCLTCIDYGSHFDYNSIWIEYVVYFPDDSICTTGNTEGQTSACTAGENGRYHFCWPIEFVVQATDISRFHVRFRVRSEDLWGRQYVAGYACLTVLLTPGRTDYRVECWRPIKTGDAVSELREFFIGQTIDIDFFNLEKGNGTVPRHLFGIGIGGYLLLYV